MNFSIKFLFLFQLRRIAIAMATEFKCVEQFLKDLLEKVEQNLVSSVYTCFISYLRRGSQLSLDHLFVQF